MSRTNGPMRRLRRIGALAGAIALGASGTALADVTGTVTNAAGVPVPGVSIESREADGSFAGFDTTDAAGAWSIATTGDVPPFTITAEYFDRCRQSPASNLTAVVPGVADGAVVPMLLDALAFCGAPFISSTLPQPTGNAWPERGQVLSGPGGLTYLQVLAPSGASGFTLSLQDGTPVGTGADSRQVALTAPATPYTGPLNVTYTSDGVVTTRQIATLVSGPVLNPNPPAGPTDLAAIVDISGSMSSADPNFRRKAAVQLLVNLSNRGDRLVGTGFDDGFTEIFPRTTISGESSKSALKLLARRRIVNDGGTDYNVGIGQAFTALAADPLDPNTPKAAIFLTDGANGGTYDNSHLRFAFNGTGRSWPICVVRLGTTGFRAEDIARLRRIARETGGIYQATPTNVELENLYFQCRGRTSGAKTLLKKTATFRVGQRRTYARKVPSGQRKATFFVSWGAGKYDVRAVQPGGKVFRKSVGKKVRRVRGKAFTFFEITSPKVGLWHLQVTRLASGARTDRATTTVTVQKKG